LHLDDVGAQPRQRQPTVLRRLVGKLDDADAGERPAAHFPSSATKRIGVPAARMSGRVTDREYHPGIEAERFPAPPPTTMMMSSGFSAIRKARRPSRASIQLPRHTPMPSAFLWSICPSG